MEQRLSLVTLGARDLARARAFYAALGWRESPASQDAVAFFQLPGLVFGLWDRAALCHDTGLPDAGGWGGITLAHNVPRKDDVAPLLARAEAAGGRILRPAADTFWGGHSGVFADTEGHGWEVAFNPFWPLDASGTPQLPGAG